MPNPTSSIVLLLALTCAAACSDPQIVRRTDRVSPADGGSDDVKPPPQGDGDGDTSVPDPDSDGGHSALDGGPDAKPDAGDSDDKPEEGELDSGTTVDSGTDIDASTIPDAAVDGGTDPDAGTQRPAGPAFGLPDGAPACLLDLEGKGFVAGERVECAREPLAFHALVAGAADDPYHDEWARLTALKFRPVSLTGVELPNGDTRYSSVFHKDPNVESFSSYRGMTFDDFTAKAKDRKARSYRLIELGAHQTPSARHYDAVWVRETKPGVSDGVADLTLSALTTKLEDMRAQGYRPIRLHGYPSVDGTLYSGVWAKDELDTNYRVVLDKNETDYAVESQNAVNERYYCVDISVYPVGNELRYTGVFVKDPTVTGYVSLHNQTERELLDRARQYTEQGYVMVDVERYSASTTTDDPRFAGVWLRRQSTNVVANFSLTDTSRWSSKARSALADMRTRLNAYAGNAGFLIEDLTNGNYLGYRITEPYYAAGTSKVLIAVDTLDRVDQAKLTLDQAVTYQDAHILSAHDSPAVPGDYTVRQSLGWMLNASSTNATDRILELLGTPSINSYLYSSRVINVGEVTSICELDRRIGEQQDACVRTSMSCFEYERWLRNAQMPAAPAAQECVAKLTAFQDEPYEAYYATLANSITPLQQAQVWRRIFAPNLLSAASRDTLLELLSATSNGYMTGLEGVFFDVQAGKSGGKHEAESWVGVGYDAAGEPGVSDDLPQYSFSLFTEDWPDDTQVHDQAAKELMRTLAIDALTILQEGR